MLQLQDIDFRRGERAILTGVNWTVEPGQHWAMLGANGSGKTTLLKIVTAYSWPSSGTVSFLDRRYGQTDIRKCRRQIGWVSSSLEERLPGRDSALAITLSGLDSSMGLYRQFTPEEESQAHEMLALVHCNHLAEQNYGTLSQGEQQRVVIARALVNRPRLLLLDEPCAGLDPAARQSFLNDLAQLAQSPSGPTMILVTHHIEEVAPFISHVLILKDGAVLAAGPKADVLTSEIISDAFAHRCQVLQDGAYFRMLLA